MDKGVHSGVQSCSSGQVLGRLSETCSIFLSLLLLSFALFPCSVADWTQVLELLSQVTFCSHPSCLLAGACALGEG